MGTASSDPDTVLLRQHRQAHRWNINREELIEKQAVPKGDFRVQSQLTDYDARVERWRRTQEELGSDGAA